MRTLSRVLLGVGAVVLATGSAFGQAGTQPGGAFPGVQPGGAFPGVQPGGAVPGAQPPAVQPGGAFPGVQPPGGVKPGGAFPGVQPPAPGGAFPGVQPPAVQPGGAFPGVQPPGGVKPGGAFPGAQPPAPGGAFPGVQPPPPGGAFPGPQPPGGFRPGGQFPQPGAFPGSQPGGFPNPQGNAVTMNMAALLARMNPKINLLGSKDVQEDLKLSAEQVKKFNDEVAKYGVGFPMPRQVYPGQDPFAPLRQANDAVQKVVDETLKPEQVKRLKQLELQQRGPYAVFDQKVIKHLNIYPAQQKRFAKAVQAPYLKLNMSQLYQDAARGNVADVMKALEPVSKQAMEEAVKVMSIAQKAKWKELVGEPFKGAFPSPLSNVVAQAGPQPGGFPGMQPGAFPRPVNPFPGVQPGVQPGAFPGVQPGAFPGVQPGAQPGAFPGVQPGAQPGAFPGVQPGAFPGVQPGGAVPGAQPGGAFPGVQPGGAVPGAQPGGAFPGVQPAR